MNFPILVSRKWNIALRTTRLIRQHLFSVAFFLLSTIRVKARREVCHAFVYL